MLANGRSIFVTCLALCLGSVASSGRPGLLGTRIRTPEDFMSYVTEAQDSYTHALAAFEAYGPSTVTQDAIEDMKVIEALSKKVFLIGGCLRTIIDTHATVEGMATSGEEALSAILRVQTTAMKNQVLKDRLGNAVQLLLASEARGFSDVGNKEEAGNALMLGLDVVDNLKYREEVAANNHRAESPEETRPLSEIAGWEENEIVMALRRIWKGTADPVAAHLTALRAANGGQEVYLSTMMPSTAQRLSARYVVEVTAAFAKAFLGLEMRLDETAFQIDKHSFTFNVFDVSGTPKSSSGADLDSTSDLIGAVYFRVENSAPISTWRYSFSDPINLVAIVAPAAAEKGSTAAEKSSSAAEKSSVAAEKGSSAGEASSSEGDSPVSQTAMLESLEIDASSYFSTFVYMTEAMAQFMKRRLPKERTAGPETGTRYVPASKRQEMDQQRMAPMSYAGVSIVTDLISLVSRDLQEALGGASATDPKKQASGYTWWSFFSALEGSAATAVTRLKLGSPEVAQVLDTAPNHFILEKFAESRGDSTSACTTSNMHKMAMSLALASMVYQKGDFRAKLFELHHALADSLGEKPAGSNTADFLKGSSETKVCEAANKLEIRPDMETLRQFLQPGTPSVGTLLPELREQIETGNVEDAIDYAPLVSELLPKTQA